MAKPNYLPHFFNSIDQAFRQQRHFLFALFVPMSKGKELNSLTLDPGIDDVGFKPTDKTKRRKAK